ncbi:MAG: 16S rRNA (cytosine(1402)-N(4))-methyltransferase RsmH [Ferruginibacter sp.]|nr:16S rRNA (cytosine(1402)-N(4))-methyltransferase RsmH [Ferruginibacter sp.]
MSVAYHVPVMLKEAIDGLQIKPSGVYVDCTFGGGGHSREILRRLDKSGRLFAFDQDEDAKKNLPNDERLVFIPQNFRYMEKFLRLHRCLKVDGILADLGVSSHQFDEPERGFSIRFEAGLDMRMDTRQQKKASDIITEYSEYDLQKLFERYGEVTNSKTLARTIVEQRALKPIVSINQFKQSVAVIVKGNPQKYFAQIFQALRMEVNDEMGALEEMLIQSTRVLKVGGRISVITFHSVEDRLVKNFYKSTVPCEKTTDVLFGTPKKMFFNLINKKPLVATPDEIKLNSRARSAKLRIAENKWDYNERKI